MANKLAGVRMVDPRTLKNHVLNIKLYGEDLPKQLFDSIAEHGIREPIMVCKSSCEELDGVVVSGRRRRVAAIKLGHKSVPVIDWLCEDEEELKEELIIRNIRSELTVEQRGRMAQELMDIATRRAASRRLSGSESPVKERAIEEVAKQVGLSASTTRRAMEAVKNVDAMKAAGKTEEAKAVVHKMNNGNVAGALKASQQAVPQKAKAPKAPKADEHIQKIDSQLALVVKHERLLRESLIQTMLAFDEKHRASAEFSGRFVKFESIMRGISEYLERPQSEVARLNVEWTKAKNAMASKE